MVSVLLLNDEKKVTKLFSNAAIRKNENSACMAAFCGEEMLGFCLFDMDKKSIIIRYIEPVGDFPLADGILRSTLHLAAQRGITNAFYEDTVPQDFLLKTGFIKETEQKSLDIDKLFGGCIH
jgi:hypothetical protein